MLVFEWDEKKDRSNRRKHGVSFAEAETVFYDPHSLTISDPDHSDDEYRFIDIGFSIEGRVLVVVYTERGDKIRLISARPATQAEKRSYERKDK